MAFLTSALLCKIGLPVSDVMRSAINLPSVSNDYAILCINNNIPTD